MRARRPLLALGALATTGALATAGLLATGAVGSSASHASPKLTSAASSGLAATPSSDPSKSCNGVLNGAGAGSLTKTLLSVSPNSTPGSYDFTFQVDSGRAPGSYRLRDCTYIDSGASGYQDEPIVAATDDKEVPFAAGSSGSTATFTITVTGVNSGDLVCDRAAVSGTGFTDKSNEVCVDPNNPPVVPEANWAAALPLAALGLTGAVVLYRRRRQLTAPVQVTTTS